MSRQSDLAARARAVTNRMSSKGSVLTEIRKSVPESGGEQAGKPPQGETSREGKALRVKPVRITVDLSPVSYRAFRQWCSDAAAYLGVATVTGTEVVRVLVDLLETDPALAGRVREELERQKTK